MDFFKDQGALAGQPGSPNLVPPQSSNTYPSPSSPRPSSSFWDPNPKVLAKVSSQKNLSFQAKVIS